MLKIIKFTLFGLAIYSISSCASYNEVAPDWAKIGESAKTQLDNSDEQSIEEDADWWNPLTWF